MTSPQENMDTALSVDNTNSITIMEQVTTSESGVVADNGVRQHHTQSAVSRTPVEVLLRIFGMCAEETNEDDLRTFDATSLINITHTCSRWRSVAVDYPPLWQNLSFRSLGLTRTMLERVGNVPVAIRADLMNTANSETGTHSLLHGLSRAMTHHGSIRELTLCGIRDMAPLLDVTLPAGIQLEALTLRGAAEKFYQTVFYVPASFFTNALQAWPLRRLVLERVFVPSGVLMRHCTQLRHLELHYATQLAVGELLSIVQASSATLEHITVDLVPLHVQDVTAPPHATVTLPKLKYLRVNCIFHDRDRREQSAFQMMQKLVFPADTCVLVQLLITQPPFGPWQIPTSIFPQLVAHANAGAPLRGLLFQQDNVFDKGGMRIKAWTSAKVPSFFDEQYPVPKIDVHVVRDPNVEHTMVHHTLYTLTSDMPFDNVVSATFARLENKTSGMLCLILPHLTGLRELTVHGSGVIHELCDGPSPLHDLKGLWTLSVYEAAGHDDIHALCVALDKRAKYVGEKLPRLFVCYSNVTFAEIDALSTYVGDIIWDGSLEGAQSVPIPVEVENPGGV
ncbi:hypothetical protein BV25DRAFT_1439500 [Artomyces pyxidatus]|uniref:Uncharacterized protein n=1 Tax=Artomyces pyxidatus TaxID=48021 RepID=A0ACB8SL66_9AGAM|nr:hypothetical protein BV25DRAFT_1439500 [Artomyces pyxidatus]